MNKRTIIGLALAMGVLCLFYLEQIGLLFMIINFAAIYDTLFLLWTGVNKSVVSGFFILVLLFNSYIYTIYPSNPLLFIVVIAIAQVSDTYQYKVGTWITNKTTIGWISKNKSYEGYIGGLILTMVTFIMFCKFWVIIFVYLCGIFGGLVSSAFKRKIGIKDYSNLLGPHGGFVDRIDSIIFPLLFIRIIEMF